MDILDCTSHAAPTRKAAPLGLVLDPAASEPLHRQIGEQVRHAILERRLAPGQRLPSSRLMASELDVARGTVLLAMDQLDRRGLRRGAGGVRPLRRDRPAGRDADGAARAACRSDGRRPHRRPVTVAPRADGAA